MALALIVNFTVAEENQEQAKVFIRKMQEHTRREPGCRLYIGHQSVEDPLRFVFYELYDDQAALDAHRASPHYAEFVTNGLLKLMATRILGQFHTVE
jgi:quinol monooxygenase YgiN